MFELRENELTWAVVGSWTASDSDADYSVRLPNPNRNFSAKVSRYSWHHYTLKGSEMLYIIMGADKDSDDSFEFVKIFGLGEISGFTRLEILEHVSLTNSIFKGSAFQSRPIGESFFFEDPRGEFPWLPAFTVRYPERRSARDAVEFCNAVKTHIFAAKP